MTNQNFQIYRAESPRYLLCLPHSGMSLPNEFIPFVTDNKRALARDVDFKVYDLIDIKVLNERGITVIVAHPIRTSIDLNRPREIALLNWERNTQGEEIVLKRPDSSQEEELLKKYYDPYFNEVENTLKNHSIKYAIDLHSMPSRPTEYHLKKNPQQKMNRPDFCLSDLEGKSCEREWIKRAIQLFEAKDYKVGYNDPYKGGQGTVFLHESGANSMQIEIKREIYMDERDQTLIPSKVQDLKEKLTDIILEIFKV